MAILSKLVGAGLAVSSANAIIIQKQQSTKTVINSETALFRDLQKQRAQKLKQRLQQRKQQQIRSRVGPEEVGNMVPYDENSDSNDDSENTDTTADVEGPSGGGDNWKPVSTGGNNSPNTDYVDGDYDEDKADGKSSENAGGGGDEDTALSGIIDMTPADDMEKEVEPDLEKLHAQCDSYDTTTWLMEGDLLAKFKGSSWSAAKICRHNNKHECVAAEGGSGDYDCQCLFEFQTAANKCSTFCRSTECAGSDLDSCLEYCEGNIIFAASHPHYWLGMEDTGKADGVWNVLEKYGGITSRLEEGGHLGFDNYAQVHDDGTGTGGFVSQDDITWLKTHCTAGGPRTFSVEAGVQALFNCLGHHNSGNGFVVVDPDTDQEVKILKRNQAIDQPFKCFKNCVALKPGGLLAGMNGLGFTDDTAASDFVDVFFHDSLTVQDGAAGDRSNLQAFLDGHTKCGVKKPCNALIQEGRRGKKTSWLSTASKKVTGPADGECAAYFRETKGIIEG